MEILAGKVEYIINGFPKGFLLISHGEKYVIPIGGIAIVHYDKIEDIVTVESDFQRVRKSVIKELYVLTVMGTGNEM